MAKGICNVLGIGNVTKTLDRLDEDEFTSSKVTDSIGRLQETKVVNEAGVYNLVLKSRKPEAEKFKRWITILPSHKNIVSSFALTHE